MTARDYVESVASLFLTLAMIMLCLLFAVYDRLAVLNGGPGDGHETSGPVPTLPALGRH